MRTYYDIGLNLFTRSFPDPERIIADAEAAGICCIPTGSEARENELVNEFVKTHDVYGTAGIHPHAADGAADKDLERIEEIILSNPKIVAVGECGLDYDRMYSTKENQLYYFKKLIALGEKLKKPLFLHERDAEEDFISCFARHEDICRRSLVHCYTGNKKTAETLARIFGLEVIPHDPCYFAGSLVEVMKGQGRGRLGHIAIGTRDIVRAAKYVERAGIALDWENAKYYPDGSLMCV